MTQSDNNSPIIKLSSIDAFRGWAILLVMIVHISQYFTLPSEGLIHLLSKGARGVQLFYVLSAFSLVYSYYSRMEKGRFFLKDYFLRRLFRIAPLFWIVIAFYLACYTHQPTVNAPNGIGWAEILSTVFFLNAWHPVWIAAIIPVGWSVAIEMMFYLFLPIVFRYVTNVQKAALWFAGSLIFAWIFGRVMMKVFKLTLPASWQELNYHFAWGLSLPAQLPIFMTGVLFYFVYRALGHIQEEKIRKTIGRVSILVASIALILLLKHPFENKLVSEYTAYGLIWALFLTGCLISPAKIFDNATTRFLGKISYSAYLWHISIINMGVFILKRYDPLILQTSHGFLATLPVLLGIITVLSYFSYRVIELYGVHLGEVLIARLKKPVAH